MLAEIWFFVLGIFLITYVILDGFDLGLASVIPLISKNDLHRRKLINAIGHVWDGNEVWLIAFGAFLFGIFPVVYAKVFSGMYIPVMLLAFALIFRAVSFEFRSRSESKLWRSIWDWTLAICSLLIMVILIVAGANVMVGVPIQDKTFKMSLPEILNPFAVFTGITVSLALVIHGLVFGMKKTDQDELYNTMKKFTNVLWLIVLALIIIWNIWAFSLYPHIYSNFVKYPLFIIDIIAIITGFVLTLVFVGKDKIREAFISSSVTVGSVVLFFGLSLFPNLVRSNVDEKFNLTVYNSASGETTLALALVVAIIGLVLVGIYQVYVYKVFSGKIKEEDIHY